MIKSKALFLLQSVVGAVLFILLSIPAFSMTGLVLKPLFLCVAGSLVICFLLLFFCREKAHLICANSLLLFELFWLLFCIIKEIQLQMQYQFPGKWVDFFYFDKLLMVGTIWLMATVFFIFVHIKKSFDFSRFYRINSIAFVVFYAFLLVYSFVLIRLERGVYPMNWTPFNTIREYIKDSASIPYEVFMMFFGNLLYFTPMGMIFYHKMRYKALPVKLIVFILFPLTAFSLLEFSQYILQNGFCEFDDMMMNSIGFWFGTALGHIADRIIYRLSKGKLNKFWE